MTSVSVSPLPSLRVTQMWRGLEVASTDAKENSTSSVPSGAKLTGRLGGSAGLLGSPGVQSTALTVPSYASADELLTILM
ncbi:hypothetical protein [Streptomyces virginiae]|uniref:hypothetical protein n=1 Tax=Streptomyces virginiae TaxID=1961 RepID=UPI0036FD6843